MKLFIPIILFLALSGIGCSVFSDRSKADATFKSIAESNDKLLRSRTEGEPIESSEMANNSGNLPEKAVSTANDNSEIETTYDRFGNKFVKRIFKNNSTISYIILTTKSLTNDTTITVYGKNGQSKELSYEQYQNILNISGNEIASVAQIQAPIDKSLAIENQKIVQSEKPEIVSAPKVTETKPTEIAVTNKKSETETKQADNQQINANEQTKENETEKSEVSEDKDS